MHQQPTDALEVSSTDETRDETRDEPAVSIPDVDGLADTMERDRAYAAVFGGARPQQLGRYLVLGCLGQGGMGTVLEAFDRSLDRRVAVKVLHGNIAERHARRLVREARALAKLSHPNVVQVYEVGEVDGQTFVAMELITGQTLGRWARQSPRPEWTRCVEIYLQAGAGLAAAHARGLIHRDFKPSNAIIDEQGRVRVLDFGLARPAEDSALATITSSGDDDADERSRFEHPLTQTGAVLGTPAYMPPEQMRGAKVDARSDQFSFCVALYEALYGVRPFSGNTMAALMMSVTEGHIEPAPRSSMVPARLRQLLLRGLAADPDERWPTLPALLTELQQLVAPRRARWSRLGLGLAVGLTALGMGVSRYAQVGQLCDGSWEQLDGIWDEQRRRQVKDAILGTDSPLAQDTWARVEPMLDDYAQRWIDTYTESCEATRVRQVQTEEVMTLRATCLSDRRLDLRALVDVLAQADGARVNNAVELVASLPRLTRCNDVGALRAALPPPEDPEVARSVQEQRERLAGARALREAGDFAISKLEADAAVQRAEQLDYPPLLAEALLQRGEAQSELGDQDSARRDLERAHLLALQHEHHELDVATARALVWVVGYKQAKHQRGQEWGKIGLALAQRRNANERTHATILNNVAIVHYEQGDLSQALALHQRALAIRERVLGPDHIDVARSAANIGNLLKYLGNEDESLEFLQRAASIIDETLGPRHPLAARMHHAMGELHSYNGAFASALREHRRALAINEQVFDADHPKIANSLSHIGKALLAVGEQQQALDHHQRALTLRERALPHDHPAIAVSHQSIALVLHRLGEGDRALDHLRHALAIKSKVLGPRHSDVASIISDIGKILHDRGELDEAIRHHRLALEIKEEQLGPRHRNVATSLMRIGRILLDQDKPAEALEHFRRALAVEEHSMNANNPTRSVVLLDISTAALDLDDFEVARTHAQQAVELLTSAQVPPRRLAQARFILAQALWGIPAQRGRARQLAEQSAQDPGIAHIVRAWLDDHPLP